MLCCESFSSESLFSRVVSVNPDIVTNYTLLVFKLTVFTTETNPLDSVDEISTFNSRLHIPHTKET